MCECFVPVTKMCIVKKKSTISGKIGRVGNS